jgi:hypothetical protein
MWLAALDDASADPRLSLGSGTLEIRPRWSRDYDNRNSQTGQQRNSFHQHLINSLCATATPFVAARQIVKPPNLLVRPRQSLPCEHALNRLKRIRWRSISGTLREADRR